MKFQFMAEHQRDYPVTAMCRALEVFRKWLLRLAQTRTEPTLSRRCRACRQNLCRFRSRNRCVYGSPRIHAELHAQGLHCARKRVARLMRELELVAKRPRHRTVTTKSEEGAAIAPNLLQQDFHADQPNQKWTTDTTYMWTPEGWRVPGGCA